MANRPDILPSTLCPHFGECGGCQYQDVAYDEQVRKKEAHLRELFAPFWNEPVAVTPSPAVWHYRNKVDVNFARKQYDTPPPPGFERETVLGFKRKGKWFWTLDIDDCRIGPEGLPALLAAVRGWARERKLTAFSSKTKDGFLRVLLVRQAKRTGQRMVVLITSDGDLDRDSFVETVLDAYPAESIYHGVFRGFAETAWAEELHLLHGAPAIEERLHVPDPQGERRLTFRISPLSFFQTNTLGTELLYGKLRAWVKEAAPPRLYDLYGGMGTIALACADLVPEIISVESVPDATADGEINADANNVQNVRFHTGKVKNFLKEELARIGEAPDAMAVLDPPRAGLTPKAMNRLLALGPRRIAYVSCKPEILARQDLPLLQERYVLRTMEAVDLFPHTPHLEALALLERDR